MKLDPVQVESEAERVAKSVAEATKQGEPFPHLRFSALLPEEFFRQLRSLDLSSVALQPRVPGDERLKLERNRFYLNVTRYSYNETALAVPLLARAFALLWNPGVTEALRQRFSEELKAAFGTADLVWEPLLTLVDDRSGYELLPHTDTPYKAVTVLLYLAQDGDDVRLGTELFSRFDMQRMQDPKLMHMRLARRNFGKVETVPYLPNQGLAFVPSPSTFHGVSEVKGKVRRLLQYQLCVSDEVAAARTDVDAGGDLGAGSRHR